MKHSERAKKNIRLQLELKRDLYEDMIIHFTRRLSTYSNYKGKGMKGLNLQIRQLKKRIKKQNDNYDRTSSRIEKLEKDGLI